MFKRLFWLTVGSLLGAGGSFWLMGKLRERVDRYRPARLRGELAGSARSLGRDLRGAVGDGRVAMRQREEELRSELRHSPTG